MEWKQDSVIQQPASVSGFVTNIHDCHPEDIKPENFMFKRSLPSAVGSCCWIYWEVWIVAEISKKRQSFQPKCARPIYLQKGSWKIKSNDKDFPFHPLFKKCLIQLTIFVWALIAGGFLQMDNAEMITKERQMATLLMRTWRLSFAVVMMEFLEWHVYWSWGVKFSWNLPNFSWFGMGLPWLFFTKERETLLMRSWFWWTVCLRSGCFILNPVNPENPFLQAFALMHWKFMISLPWKACWDLFLFRMPWPRKPSRMVDLGLSSCFDMHRENRISGTTAPCTMIGLVILFVEDQSHPPACLRSHHSHHIENK